MSTDQESARPENETTPKDSSSHAQNLTQNTATNEPETEPKPDSGSSVPQVENDITSSSTNLPPNEGIKEDDNATSEQGSAPHEVEPPANETSKDSDDTTQAAETSKQEPHDAATLGKDAIPQSVADDNTSNIPSPPSNDPAQASSIDKQEAGDTKTSSPDSDPSAQEIPPAQDESSSQNQPPPEDNVAQITEIRSLETEDIETSKQDSATSADLQPVDTTPKENATISKESSPPKNDVTQSTQTRNQEIDHTDAIEDHPLDQYAAPSENEATGRDVSAPNDVRTQPISSGTPERVPNRETATKAADSRQNKSSIWKQLRCFSLKRHKGSSSKTSGGNESSMEKLSSKTSGVNESSMGNLSSKTSGVNESSMKSLPDNALPTLIQADIKSVDRETSTLRDYNDRLIDLNVDARKEFATIPEGGNYKELRKSMIKLKLLIPSQKDVDSSVFKDLQSRLKSRESIPTYLLEKMPQLHGDGVFCDSPEMKDFQSIYKNLDHKLRLCLLCFSIFPGNETIRKRLMVRWWLAEGLLSEVEEAAKYFGVLKEKGFIVPVNNNRSPYIGRYRMHPLYQSMLKMLAEKAKFFNFDKKGKPTQNYKESFQACLVGEGLLSYDDLKANVVSIDGLEKVHLVMNVEEPILDFKPHWFSSMTNVNVLYLGRWQASDAAHIEVEETNFLDGLEDMNSIKFLSLQGISNIIKLTESILRLKRLECLDLRACHNLEAIPKGIGSLTRLTHLDMSECYLLDHMPKSLSKLQNLKVFKGFVVSKKNLEDSNSCTLVELKELKNLTKLCIYTTWKHFPREEDISCLENLTKLCKLSIAWGGEALKEEREADTAATPSEVKGDNSDARKERDASKWFQLKANNPILSALSRGGEASKAKTEGGTSQYPLAAGGDTIKEKREKQQSKLPSTLKKLDLKCFPLKDTPSWLEIANLENLEKLYIRGGRFSDLGQYHQHNDHSHTKVSWKVKVLRLKYLSNLEMEWRQLHELFPDLVYLEKISCPKLTLFNCGHAGVWTNPTKLKAMEEGR
ncbi:uncharacterized protein [Henckelia pumila]|uniref:uncharacterized protein n=1 Tax=Henckelia pumila TaxID=405737 RepID=UPI003C6DF527